jgi:hypothetical protein
MQVKLCTSSFRLCSAARLCRRMDAHEITASSVAMTFSKMPGCTWMHVVTMGPASSICPVTARICRSQCVTMVWPSAPPLLVLHHFESAGNTGAKQQLQRDAGCCFPELDSAQFLQQRCSWYEPCWRWRNAWRAAEIHASALPYQDHSVKECTPALIDDTWMARRPAVL